MDLPPNLCILTTYTFYCYTRQCTVQALIYKGSCTVHWSPKYLLANLVFHSTMDNSILA